MVSSPSRTPRSSSETERENGSVRGSKSRLLGEPSEVKSPAVALGTRKCEEGPVRTRTVWFRSEMRVSGRDAVTTTFGTPSVPYGLKKPLVIEVRVRNILRWRLLSPETFARRRGHTSRKTPP